MSSRKVGCLLYGLEDVRLVDFGYWMEWRYMRAYSSLEADSSVVLPFAYVSSSNQHFRIVVLVLREMLGCGNEASAIQKTTKTSYLRCYLLRPGGSLR